MTLRPASRHSSPWTRRSPRSCRSCSLLPPFDPAGPLTLRKLLSHTAGVPDYLGSECAEGDRRAGCLVREPIRPDSCGRRPGRLWSYSNLGFSMAGLVAERAERPSGFASWLRAASSPRWAWTPPPSTWTRSSPEADHAVAHPAVPVDPTFTRCALVNPPGLPVRQRSQSGQGHQALLAGGGGGRCSRSPCWRWRCPTPRPRRPPTCSTGLGLLERSRIDGRVIIGHPGDLPGMHSAWWMVPAGSLRCDHAGQRRHLLTDGGRDPGDRRVRGRRRPRRPFDWSTPPSDWGRYVGLLRRPDTGGGLPALWPRRG